MKPERRAKILAYNAEKAKDRQAAEDLITIFEQMPNGVRKQLYKKSVVKEIFDSYGVEVSP